MVLSDLISIPQHRDREYPEAWLLMGASISHRGKPASLLTPAQLCPGWSISPTDTGSQTGEALWGIWLVFQCAGHRCRYAAIVWNCIIRKFTLHEKKKGLKRINKIKNNILKYWLNTVFKCFILFLCYVVIIELKMYSWNTAFYKIALQITSYHSSSLSLYVWFYTAWLLFREYFPFGKVPNTHITFYPFQPVQWIF